MTDDQLHNLMGTMPPGPEGKQYIADLALKRAFSMHELKHARAESYFIDHLDQMVVEVRKAVFGTEQSREVTSSVGVPADWWQHLKQRFAPRWFIRRWPLVYRHIPTTTVLKFGEIE